MPGPPKRVRRPGSRATVTATVSGRTQKVTNGAREVKPRTEVHVIPLPDIPDGPAAVSVQHGAKTWGHHAPLDMGMTVESTCRVHIPCARHEDVLEAANDKASELALRFAEKNAKPVQKMLAGFLRLQQSDFFGKRDEK